MTFQLSRHNRGFQIRQDMHDTALHCLIVEGRFERSDFYRFSFEHRDILTHGLEALVSARLEYALRQAEDAAKPGVAA